MCDFISEFDAYVSAHGHPERLELLLCDINSVLRGKWLPAHQYQKLVKGDVRLPLSTYVPTIMGNEISGTGLGIEVGDPDGKLIPIAGTLAPAPWLSGQVASVQVEMLHPDNSPCEFSPRHILETMLKSFNARGLKAVVAAELEFYILNKRSSADEPPTPPEFSPDAQNYEMRSLNQHSEFLGQIQAMAKTQNMATDTLIAEYGPGQFEINFHHTDDVLKAADQVLQFRRMIHGIAANHNLEATFMAKPYANHPGSGMHIHLSLLDQAGLNIFSAQDKKDLSPTLKSAVAGLLDTMRDLQVIFAPHLNAYRRFGPYGFAPSSPDWGLDNRAAAIRIPALSGPNARLEHRISCADANPYLVLAAILGGIRHGLNHNPELPAPLAASNKTASPPLSSDWMAALKRFNLSSLATDIFGPYRDIFSTIKQNEIEHITKPITAPEYRYYLGRI